MQIISTENLTHYYGSKKVFEDISFSLNRGSITGLLGKNGEGKTTIINILNGFLTPTSGNAYIFNEDAHELSNATKAKIGFLIEGHIQYDFMSIQQIEKFYAGFYPNWKKNQFYELTDLLGLKPNHKLSKMSCGQRSQVALGLIFAQQPELIILDDFSMGLDPGYRRLFIDYLRHHVKKENITVFVTSHIIQDMEKLIDDVMILNDGKIAHKSELHAFMQTIHMFKLPIDQVKSTQQLEDLRALFAVERLSDEIQICTATEMNSVTNELIKLGVDASQLSTEKITLEDAFIGLTGRY